MHVLVTNDDGIESAGLAVLVRAALDRGHTVQVAAPAHEYSGASASLAGEEKDGKIILVSADPPGMPEGVDAIGVKAAPGLIAFLASYGAFGDKPDIVLSGVNLGANTGHATLHSGTVGAALTAATHGIKGMAVSVTSGTPEHWDTVQRVATHALEWLEGQDVGEHILNINVPDVPWSKLRGLTGAHLAPFGAVQARIDERFTEGIDVTYIAEDADDDDPGSDHYLLTRGWATATMLRAPVDSPKMDVPTFDGEGTEADVEAYQPDSARVMTTRESD
ncbi:5'/3'-nucleotidase SurE [Yimella sp. cx-51]|uniref:5'/3'-nucleotidase SurE n=1 Tax=Yimella sp. cx-51 TaxID=2770551 RepID=UPI00165E8F74|nr:5'/3'-nucleotidase SurE [Yimella sp. cx-51]MBC9958309.1 5'/3'-nucleotidase SurE [Yimella sp. cx-51]MBD2760510.1 5'/3'-nucleotidase SurE [Yimella sp. cx-573]QTH38244.1 5'/3'-nucleotidase SurE [Yimella sp. cx-51]